MDPANVTTPVPTSGASRRYLAAHRPFAAILRATHGRPRESRIYMLCGALVAHQLLTARRPVATDDLRLPRVAGVDRRRLRVYASEFANAFARAGEGGSHGVATFLRACPALARRAAVFYRD